MTLGERMKEYEMQSRTKLLRRTPVIIRLDGKAFHTFTRGLDKPFDKEFVRIMQQTMLKLCENIQGCVLGYTQSDEITLVLIDYNNIDTCAWFDNQVQKIVSVSSSMATLYFNELVDETFDKVLEENKVYDEFREIDDNSFTNSKVSVWENKLFRATFDSRAFNLPKEEVCNCLIWRQQDAIRNSILSLAQSLYSQKQIEGIKCNALQDKMFTEKGVNWNELETTLKRGSCAIKDENGKWFIDNEIPIFTEKRDYIDKLIILDKE